MCGEGNDHASLLFGIFVKFTPEKEDFLNLTPKKPQKTTFQFFETLLE